MISVAIVVRDGEKHLEDVLQAVSQFDEVIVVDTGSTDRTEEIAKSFSNVRFHKRKFEGFGKSRNYAASLALHDWVLAIDDDEVLSHELASEILSLKLESNHLYALKFLNYFNGKQIKWCGWYPQTIVRLYNRKETCFSEALVHEGVITKGFKKIELNHQLNHFSYDSISDFIIKMDRYSSLFAEENKLKRSSSPVGAFFRGIYRFIYSYFIRLGFLGGFEGFTIASAQGLTCFYKYLKLYHANQLEKSSCQKRISATS